jgi:hypothetical protein
MHMATVHPRRSFGRHRGWCRESTAKAETLLVSDELAVHVHRDAVLTLAACQAIRWVPRKHSPSDMSIQKDPICVRKRREGSLRQHNRRKIRIFDPPAEVVKLGAGDTEAR